MVHRILKGFHLENDFKTRQAILTAHPVCQPASQPAPYTSEEAEPSWRGGADKPNESWPQSLFA